MTVSPILLPPGKQTFWYPNGSPLLNGTVAHYLPGTLTPATTWSEPTGTVPNANPLTLDGNGQAVIYGVGTYRQIIKDLSGNTIWDQQTSDGNIGAWRELMSATAGNSASLDFTGLTGYAAYAFLLSDLIPATDGSDLWARVSTDNGATWKSSLNYEWGLMKNWASVAGVNQGGGCDSQMKLATVVSGINTGASTQGYSGEFRTSGDLAQTALEKSFFWNGTMSNTSNNTLRVDGMGSYCNDSHAVNGVRFLFSSGNIGSGIIRCFGITG